MKSKVEEGSIVIIKNTHNVLEFVHTISGTGRSSLEYDVSHLSSDKAHMFTFTWSMKNKEINLYIDAEVVAKSQI